MSSTEALPRPEVGKFFGFDYIEMWVGNAKQAASFYITRFGFTPLAYKGLETGHRDICTWVVKTGKVVLAFSTPYGPEQAEITAHLGKHGDGVRDVAFSCQDARGIFDKAVSRGATAVQEPTELTDANGTVIIAKLKTYGDTVHTLVERGDYQGTFLPGFIDCDPDPFNAEWPKIYFNFVDHVVGNQGENEMEIAADWYRKYLDFHRYWSVDENQIHTEFSSLRSIVMADYDEVIKMPLNEPAPGKRKSQIQEFCDYYGGAGVQHIALNVDDILTTIDLLRKRGIQFLKVPATYYQHLRQRLSEAQMNIQEDLDKIEELGILVDFDENGYLLQLFTKPVEDRPTLFFEIIQRRNNNGFGIGNFKALFEALEDEQNRRGNL